MGRPPVYPHSRTDLAGSGQHGGAGRRCEKSGYIRRDRAIATRQESSLRGKSGWRELRIGPRRLRGTQLGWLGQDEGRERAVSRKDDAEGVEKSCGRTWEREQN